MEYVRGDALCKLTSEFTPENPLYDCDLFLTTKTRRSDIALQAQRSMETRFLKGFRNTIYQMIDWEFRFFSPNHLSILKETLHSKFLQISLHSPKTKSIDITGWIRPLHPTKYVQILDFHPYCFLTHPLYPFPAWHDGHSLKFSSCLMALAPAIWIDPGRSEKWMVRGTGPMVPWKIPMLSWQIPSKCWIFHCPVLVYRSVASFNYRLPKRYLFQAPAKVRGMTED